MVASISCGKAPEFPANDLRDRTLETFGHFLGQTRDFHAFVDDDQTVIGRDFVGDNAQQSRFAGAVAPDQTDALAALDLQIGVF